MLIQKYNVGDYIVTINNVKITSTSNDRFYTFRIKTRINNKLTTVGQSYIYYSKLEDCQRTARERLEEVMLVKSMLNM